MSSSELSHPDQQHEPMPEGDETPPAGVRAMAVFRWVLVLAMAVAAATSVGRHFGVLPGHGESAQMYQCPMHPTVVQDHPGDCPICGMALVPMNQAPKGAATNAAPPSSQGPAAHDHAKHAYYCPMHPEVSSDDPNATCPKCNGMPLAKRSEQRNGEVIELSAERVQQMGIRTAPVEQRSVAPVLRAVGVISADESRVVRVHTRVSGYVEQLFVDRTFTSVREGQALYSIYSPELLAAEREILRARTWTGKPADTASTATDLNEAGQKRLEVLGLTRKDVEELIKLGEAPRTFTVHAPSAGVVTQKDLVRGSYVEAGALMFELTDLRDVWVIAEIPQRDLEHLRKGDSAQVQVASEPKSRTGHIDFVYPMLDASRRTARVRITVPNPDLSLRPGVSAEVSIALDPIHGLFAPRDAVLESGEESYVFVARDHGQFVRTKVRAGSRAEDWVNVVEGLREGDRVVTSATFLLDSETRLQNVANEADNAPQAGGQP